uniref:Nuclear pore complex protein Nup214 n=1 Tax=Oryzias sinensis TaxID=183150 RepID=A0A8C7XMW7_9TELE
MSDDADSPPERLMKDFQFRQLKKVEVFEPPEHLPKDRSSLLTVSNKYGLTFVGLDRTFKVYQTQDILSADKADPGFIVTVELALHHLALSCDELTLSVCGVAEGNLFLTFYDVRTFINGKSTQKLPFATFRPDVPPGTLVQDLKWNPANVSMLAACLSDGSMMILDVTDLVKMQAKLPSTSVGWSPKGKQVAAGKMNGTVSQYTPALEEKKVIPCPHFYTSEDPVKALDVLWLRTFAFAVTYAAADGSLETPPELVLVSLPKKDEKVDTKYLNFGDIVYGTCTERQHHYFLSHIEDWDLVFAASAASIEVSVIARQDDKMWELWTLEDAGRAELRVTESNEDTLPLGLAIDYTSQQEIYITDEKTLPPAPTLMMLSTEGLLCSFALVNQNPGAKQLVSPPTMLTPEGERLPKPGERAVMERVAGSVATAPAKIPAAVPSAPPAFPSISLPSSAAAPSLAVSSAPSSITPFSMAPTAPVTSAFSGFSFSVPSTFSTTSAPVAAFALGGSVPFGSGSSGFSFASKPPSETPSALSAFSFNSPSSKPPAVAAPSAAVAPQSLSTIAHFQKELDDLKARSSKADVRVGTNDDMKDLRKESEDLHIFTLEIKETTESLHGDIGTLKTTLLEGFAGAEEAKTQNELGKDKNYRQLLYKKPLDPRSEEQLKEIRRLYQYVKFAVEDVNDVLDVEWEKHLEKKKKQKHMVVPGREGLFNTLSNNLCIINQQKNRLDQLIQELSALRLYNLSTISQKLSFVPILHFIRVKYFFLFWCVCQAVKVSPLKQSQLRNFLSKGKMPPVRSTAPANLSRSAFLAPKNLEDLDDVSSTSSLSQSIELLPSHLELEEEEELQPLQPSPMNSMTQSLPTPRHPTVVRTPSIQPGFGAIQSTPLTKMHPVPGMGFVLSPIINPGNGAESTALATKTVKHGAPPAERSIPVTISAQQAAATAALRRQMANQKTGRRNNQLKHSLKSRFFPSTMCTQVKFLFIVVFAQYYRCFSFFLPGCFCRSTGFSFSSVTQGAGVSQGNQQCSCVVSWQLFPLIFSPSFTPFVSAGKDVNKFSIGGNGKGLFGQTGEEPFSLPTKSNSPGLSTGSSSSSANSLGEVAKQGSTVTGSKTEPQPLKAAGGETLGSFSGLRVGHGEEANESSTKTTAPAFSFGNAGLGHSKSAPQFNFGSTPLKSAEDVAAADLPKVSGSGSLFKPPDSNSMPTFSITPSTTAASTLPTSLSSLLAAPTEQPKATPQPSESTPAALPELSTKELAVDLASVPTEPEPLVTAVATTTTPTSAATTLPTVTPVPTADSSSTVPAETETTPPPAPPTASSTEEATPNRSSTPAVSTSTAAVPLTIEVTSAALPAPASEKPGSIFTSATPATTTSNSVGAIPAINTAAPTTTTAAVITSAATTAANVFGQPAAPPASSAPATTGFGSSGFGAPTETGFGKSVFGAGGFGQPASIGGTSSGFSFTQSAFGATSSSATTGGGGLFGAPTVTNASSFSFGTSSSSTPSSTGLFSQSTPSVFGQSSGFGQGSMFRNNTTTSSASGFSFGQPSGKQVEWNLTIFVASALWQQQPSTGGGLFGQSSTGAATSSSGGFFSGLGGKPSEDAANKNPFGTTASTGPNSLFGSSSAKTFGFGQPSFGEQKPSGTFSTGGGSVACQGFGSFSTPSKSTSGFGSAPVFGSPPSFGGSPAFGGGASFSSSPSFSNPLASQPGKVFGEGTAAASMGGFGFSSPPSAPSFGTLATQTAPSFGSLAQQGPGFGSQPSSFSGFGQQPQTGGATPTLAFIPPSHPSGLLLEE